MDNCKELNNRHLISPLVEKKYRVLRHFIFLIGFFLLMYFGDALKEFSLPTAYYVVGTTYFFFIIMFYVNMYVLVPVFLFRARYILYTFFLVLMVYLGLEVIGYFHENYFNLHRLSEITPRFRENYYVILIICASLISVSTTVKLLQRWIIDNDRITELKNITYMMELNELKNQISPHFLFNMLNNVKALIRTNPEMATKVIMNLSEFLRYQLYESNQEKTLLSSEIYFLSNFLDLEKIRKDNLEVTFENQLDKKQINSLLFPPGLFTVFIENAIKHSVDTSENLKYIKINLRIENKKLYFSCINSKSNSVVIDKKNSGLGLVNIKRRLDLLYNNSYYFNIDSLEKEFHVNLVIPI